MLEQFGQFGAGLERRMQNRTLTEYRNRRNWLLREIKRCEKNIKEIKKQINRVHKSYETNKIGYEQYIILLADRYNGKTLSQWKENREKLQKLYEKHVNDYDKGLSLSLLLIILTLGLLPLIILGDFNGLMEITGSAVEQIYGFGVPLEVDEEVINTTTPFEATTSTTIILPIENYTIPIKNITAPVLIKNIPNIEIQKNSFAELSVLEYFENAETVFILQIENISTSSSGYNIKILPDKEFVGIRTLGIMAINDLAKIESNFFNVSVLEVRAPELVKKIPDISINKNSFIELNILEYFLNADQFFLLQTTNITTSIYDHTVKIQPDVGFIGTRTMKIISTNELGKAESDFFNLFILENVTEIPGEEVTTTSTTTLLEGTSTTTDIILTTTSTIEITLPETTTTSTTSTSILSGFGEQAFTVQQAEGLWTLYFNNTASGGSCPTNSKLMYTSVSGATAITWPGDFDSGLPGGADAGQWAPGKPNRGNTTNSFEINTTTQTSRTSDSFGSGWLYDGNLTGWVLSDGNFTFNLSIVGGAMVETVIAERIFARASIVTCSGGAFTHVKDLFTTGCTGGSCGGGQGGWRANEGARIQHPGVNIINNTYVNVTANDTSSHQFSEGQWLFIELGFGDGGSTTNRAIGLRYNLVGSYVITPNMATTTTSTSSSSTSSSTLPHANLTLYLRNSTGVELYKNITALTNESINITSSFPYPGDANMTLYVM
ncbi:hypothetical protein HYV88_01945, partial [Candidatus Woesearchaeota archaeon]|nr:hypothetical protein [Candidatus Woesearchaeota archaeon]